MGTGTSADLKAKDVMERDLKTVSPSMRLFELEQFLVSHDLSGAPVVEKPRRLVGIVSRSDIIRRLVVERSLAGYTVDLQHEGSGVAAGDAEAENRLISQLASDHLRGLTVGDVMTRDVQSVAPDTAVGEVARTMLDEHIHRVMVVDGAELVGIITSTDLIALIAADD
jgi:CBS domain-containing protein